MDRPGEGGCGRLVMSSPFAQRYVREYKSLKETYSNYEMGGSNMLFKRGKTVSGIDPIALTTLHRQLKSSFSTIKEEMEEHLQAINENTSEIQQNSDRIFELESRLERLEDRMSDIHMMFRKILDTTKVSIDLTLDEQKVFLILYTHDTFLSGEQIAERFAIPAETVKDCLCAMGDKGIQIDSELLNGELFYKLDAEFKTLQAKEQLVKIDSSITQQFQNKLLKRFFSE